MRFLRMSFVVALLPWLAGCYSILSEEPLGEEIAILDPQEVNGMWLAETGQALWGIRVLEATKGTLIYWIAADYGHMEKADESLQCDPPQVSRSCPTDGEHCSGMARLWKQKDSEGNFFYFPELLGWSHKEFPGDLHPTFFTGTFRGRGASIYILESHGSRLKEYVAKGALPGRVDEEGRVVFGPLLPKHYRILLARDAGIFRWEDQSRFIKLPSELDPCRKSKKSK